MLVLQCDHFRPEKSEIQKISQKSYLVSNLIISHDVAQQNNNEQEKKCLLPAYFSFLTHYQTLDSSELKEFAEDNFKFDENGRKLSKWVENTVGKGQIARCEQFLLFPRCFQKAFSQGRQKVSLCGNGLNKVYKCFNEVTSIWFCMISFLYDKLLAFSKLTVLYMPKTKPLFQKFPSFNNLEHKKKIVRKQDNFGN